MGTTGLVTERLSRAPGCYLGKERPMDVISPIFRHEAFDPDTIEVMVQSLESCRGTIPATMHGRHIEERMAKRIGLCFSPQFIASVTTTKMKDPGGRLILPGSQPSPKTDPLGKQLPNGLPQIWQNWVNASLFMSQCGAQAADQ